MILVTADDRYRPFCVAGKHVMESAVGILCNMAC
jgi:hypothetical protein